MNSVTTAAVVFACSLTALVLGLVTASTKGTFDDLSKTIRHNAAGILSLDRALARYGPETA